MVTSEGLLLLKVINWYNVLTERCPVEQTAFKQQFRLYVSPANAHYSDTLGFPEIRFHTRLHIDLVVPINSTWQVRVLHKSSFLTRSPA